jgi:hypothetical protein
MTARMSVRKTDDAAFAERWTEVRIAVSLPGTILFVDRCDARGKPLTFDCRAVNMSPSEIAVASALEVSVGERAMLRLEQFGEFRGAVSRQLSGGFVLKIEQAAAESKALASRINGFDKIKNHDAPERRRARRVIPRNPDSLLTWPDGRIEACLILDISSSGAAVSAQTLPEIGMALALGRLVGRVVRLFKGGFAIQFTEGVQRGVALKSLYK